MRNRFTVAITTIVLALCSGFAFAADARKEAGVCTLKARTIVLEKQLRELQKEIRAVRKTDNYRVNDLTEMFVHGPAIVTSPAMGVRRSAEDASDLVVNLSSMNEDLTILRLREKMDNYALEHELPSMERPVIAISGGVEGIIDYKDRENYIGRKLADINLSKAEFDIVGLASPWATAVINVVYEDGTNKHPSRIDNSRFKLDRGFLTIGQLSKCPFYLTIGQLFAPFGNYSSNMITDPSTKILGRVKDRMAVLGSVVKSSFGNFDFQVYGFAGDTKRIEVGGYNLIDHGGANFDYTYAHNKLKVMVGGSFIGNIMESDGVYDAVVVVDNDVYRRIHGLSARTKISYDMFNFRAEYVGAGRSFDDRDMTFNNSDIGARPQALNLEGAVEFKTFNKPSIFALGYGRTWEALGLRLPKRNLFVEYNISLIKNTILGFEYRYDIDYGTSDECYIDVDNLIRGTGRHSNIFTTKLGVYF